MYSSYIFVWLIIYICNKVIVENCPSGVITLSRTSDGMFRNYEKCSNGNYETLSTDIFRQMNSQWFPERHRAFSGPPG